jgi:GNAT superfamily N-acetyltransferase
MTFSRTDIELARRMEHAEAANGFALARAGASIVAEPMLGGCALFAGVGSPMTHALGIGMDGTPAKGELDRLEDFFHSRGSAALIDYCPLANAELTAEIFSRGYQVIEFNNLLVRRLDAPPAAVAGPRVVAAGAARQAEWNNLILRGFSPTGEVDAEMAALMGSLPATGENYFAEFGGEPLSGAALAMADGVAILFGDATLHAARGRGAQLALIQHRLKIAAETGCEWAMATVVPGSASHRNYERLGFELFYMRVNIQSSFS